jgi:hypothetical protein
MNCRAFHYYSNHTSRNWTIERRDFVTCNPGSDPGCISLFPYIQPVREIFFNRSLVADPSWAGMNDRDLLKYLDSCNPVSDSSCGGWTIDGKPAKNIPGVRPFSETPSPRKDPCDTFLIQPHPDLKVPEDIVTSRYWANDYLAVDVCELRVTIPAGSGEPVQTAAFPAIGTTATSEARLSPAMTTPNSGSGSPKKQRSPVESLYCRVIEMLGRRCE